MQLPTVTELFDRDPLGLSNAEIDRIVTSLRESRQRFLQGELKAGMPEKKKSAAQKKAEAISAEVGDVGDLLSDLGL